MKLLQRVFKFRTCELDIRDTPAGGDPAEDPRRFFRPCLLYPIRQCTGPCAMKIGKEAYRADIDRFIHLFDTAVQQSALETGDALGLKAAVEELQLMNRAAFDARPEVAAATAAPPVPPAPAGFGGGRPEARQRAGRFRASRRYPTRQGRRRPGARAGIDRRRLIRGVCLNLARLIILRTSVVFRLP